MKRKFTLFMLTAIAAVIASCAAVEALPSVETLAVADHAALDLVVDGKPRFAIVGRFRAEAALTVEIPSARDGEGRHAYAYEVRAVDGTGTVRLTRRVLAEDFNLPAVSHGLPTRCRLPLDGIPQSLRLDVRPRDSYGQPGDWISAYE